MDVIFVISDPKNPLGSDFSKIEKFRKKVYTYDSRTSNDLKIKALSCFEFRIRAEYLFTLQISCKFLLQYSYFLSHTLRKQKQHLPFFRIFIYFICATGAIYLKALLLPTFEHKYFSEWNKHAKYYIVHIPSASGVA